MTEVSRSRRPRWIRIALLVALVASVAFLAGRMGAPSTTVSSPPTTDAGSVEETVWTCSMHPQIRLPQPGLCPICAMDLIPLEMGSGSGSGDGPTLMLSPNARTRAGIQTSEVQRRSAVRVLHLSGTLTEDPSRVRRMTAWVAGRIESLHVATVGTVVAAGDPLFDLYSPDLVTAVEELRRARAGSSAVSGSAARARLRQWGLGDAEIDDLAAGTGRADRVTIPSPVTGVVTSRHVDEGAYVATGAPVYTVSDLDLLWLELDAAESDLAWLAEGQRVAFETRAFPGRSFTGEVSLVEPVFDRRTRTVPVRVTVPNPDGHLRPGMFVSATVSAELDPGGEPPLIVPATAPLLTGTRAVVYVADPGEPGTFHGREITLGPRTEAGYVVTAGLEAGEQVVTNGAFKIDSALQIRAEQSMMSAGNEASREAEEVPAAVHEHLRSVLRGYFSVHEALASDALEAARAAASSLPGEVGRVPRDLLDPAAAQTWDSVAAELVTASRALASASSLEAARATFETLSRSAIRLVRSFGAGGDGPVHVIHCPMAFDNRGADWLQPDPEVRNPYFGSAMYRCGDVVEVLAAGEDPSGTGSSAPTDPGGAR